MGVAAHRNTPRDRRPGAAQRRERLVRAGALDCQERRDRRALCGLGVFQRRNCGRGDRRLSYTEAETRGSAAGFPLRSPSEIAPSREDSPYLARARELADPPSVCLGTTESRFSRNHPDPHHDAARYDGRYGHGSDRRVRDHRRALAGVVGGHVRQPLGAALAGALAGALGRGDSRILAAGLRSDRRGERDRGAAPVGAQCLVSQRGRGGRLDGSGGLRGGELQPHLELDTQTKTRGAMVNSPVLEIRELRAGYGPRTVLENISIALNAGEWFVLLGPNGCGKSTLLDCVVSRLIPSGGEISIAGHSLRRAPFEDKRQLGYGCAPDVLPALLTARQCLEVHAAAKGLSVIGDDLLTLADELRFTPYLEAFVDTLSLGTRQKLAVLLALVGDPLLIVLDEAFTGLDPASALLLKRHLRARIERRGAALLLATHSLDIVEHYADRAAVLIDGRLKHVWPKEELQRLRNAHGDFEAALAEAIGES